VIVLDGRDGEGGGQILRTALGVSMLTGLAFRIDHIRANRRKPGLMRQHLTAVRAAAEICGAEMEGAHLNSRQLVFRPNKVRGGNYHFSVGTAGSTMLVLQTVLPALIGCESASTLVLEGGTHNPMAPPFDFIAEAFLPLLERMGAKVSATLDRHGFFPAGGGRVRVTVSPMEEWQPLELVERGARLRTSVRVLHANIPGHVARRELAVCSQKLNLGEADLESVLVHDSHGPGNVILARLDWDSLTEVFASFGQAHLSAEKVARDLCKQVKTYLKAEAPVGDYLADQIMLPFALAGGGSFSTHRLTRHASTQLETLRFFLGNRWKVVESDAGVRLDFHA